MALVSLLYSTVYVPVTVKEKSINVSTTGEVRTMKHFFQRLGKKLRSTILTPLNPTCICKVYLR